MKGVEFKKNRYWQGASNEKNNFWLKNDYVRLCYMFLLRILFSLLFVFLFKANKLIKTIHFIFCICIHNIFFTVTNNQQIEAPISESECNLINYDPFDFATGLPQRNYSRSDIKVLY